MVLSFDLIFGTTQENRVYCVHFWVSEWMFLMHLYMQITIYIVHNKLGKNTEQISDFADIYTRLLYICMYMYM